MADKNIVSNTSKAYGYNYASLADIINQGFTVPKMKTGTDLNGKEYVFYFDTELNEWIRGAEIIIPENIVNKDGKNKMNSAQLYGSAITYARRYTAHLALQLACDDDKKLEAQEPERKPSNKSGMWDEPTPAQQKENQKSLKILADQFRKVVPQDAQAKILAEFKNDKAEDLGTVKLQRYIEHYEQR